MKTVAHQLRSAQRAFARTITPCGTFARGPRLLAAAVAVGARLAATARLGIYRFAYSTRLREVLANDYPGVLRLVGGTTFDELVRAYVVAHPSTHPNLNQLGRRFPAFLAGRRSLPDRAAIVDIARVELAEAIAFDAIALPPLDAKALARHPERRWHEVRLRLQPAVQLLALRHDVTGWHARRPGSAPSTATTWLCVSRPQLGVHRLDLDREQFRVLTALQAGLPLAAALRQAPAGAPIAAWFARWASAGLFAASGHPRESRRRR